MICKIHDLDSLKVHLFIESSQTTHSWAGQPRGCSDGALSYNILSSVESSN